MFKIMCFLKRKAGMNFEDFREYYESHHRLLGEKHSRHAKHYARRYCLPLDYAFTAPEAEPPYDVVTEMWFENRADYDASMANLTRQDVLDEISRDEERLFDRSATRLVMLEEHVSDPARLAL